MGLDVLDLIMEFEERFDTKFSDIAAEQLQTVGCVHEYLMNRIRWSQSPCESATMFYAVRRVLTEEINVRRPLVRPRSDLVALVETQDRSRFWDSIQSGLMIDLPSLRRSKWLQLRGDLFPDRFVTVGDLAQRCVEENRIGPEFGPEDGERVWDEVRGVVRRVLGVDADRIERDTHFLYDLGI